MRNSIYGGGGGGGGLRSIEMLLSSLLFNSVYIV